MRAKLLAAAVLTACVTGAGFRILSDRARHHSRSPVEDATLALQTGQALPEQPAALSASDDVQLITRPEPSMQNTNDSDRQERVSERSAELMALAMNNDPNARDMLLSELQNPDKDIRSAAIDALIQLGDRSAVPRMRQLADRMQDPDEKADMLAAADFLDLPALTDFLAQQQAQKLGRTPPGATQRPTNSFRPHSHPRNLPPLDTPNAP